jgi:uncharacterized protein
MMLSDLDGFLTGIAVGPELVLPSEWLPLVFGGDAPEFADEAEAKAILGAIMGRYNEILRQVADDDLQPVFWADRNGTLIAADWAEGFLQAIMLRADAWEALFKSKRDGALLVPILALCGDENGASLLGIPPDEEDRVMEEAAEFIPACVAAIDAYWRESDRGKSRCRSPPVRHPSPSKPQAKSAATTRALAAPAKSSKSAAATPPEHKHTPALVLTGCLRMSRTRGARGFPDGRDHRQPEREKR